MDQHAEFIDYGKVDIAELISKITAIPDALWDSDMMVQKANPTHKETRVLLFYWPSDVSNPETGVKREAWIEYEKLIEPILDKVKTIYGEGSTPRCMLANLRPGCHIIPHRDIGLALRGSHRLHVPLITNDKVDFIINSDRKEMKVGRLYEFNNQLEHSVKNNGDESRVHLIIDYWHDDCKCGDKRNV